MRARRAIRQGPADSGRADLRNILDQHLLPWFGGFRLDEINVEEVDAYAAAKRREGRIGPTYLNKTLATLRAILRDAVRYGRIPRNPADDVRVASARFNGSYLDSAMHIEAVLDAAGEFDRRGRLRQGHGRALLATLTFAGLRIDEALSLLWATSTSTPAGSMSVEPRRRQPRGLWTCCRRFTTSSPR